MEGREIHSIKCHSKGKSKSESAVAGAPAVVDNVDFLRSGKKAKMLQRIQMRTLEKCGPHEGSGGKFCNFTQPYVNGQNSAIWNFISANKIV